MSWLVYNSEKVKRKKIVSLNNILDVMYVIFNVCNIYNWCRNFTELWILYWNTRSHIQQQYVGRRWKGNCWSKYLSRLETTETYFGEHVRDKFTCICYYRAIIELVSQKDEEIGFGDTTITRY